MISTVLFLHLMAIGIWAGCVATEAVLEVTLDKVPPPQSGLAHLHARIDRFVEIPAIVVAVLTGGAMLHHATWDHLLMAKVGLGVSAVVLNTAAAYTVHRRLQCLNAGNMQGYAAFHRWHERIGVGCVLSIVGALILGGYRVAA